MQETLYVLCSTDYSQKIQIKGNFIIHSNNGCTATTNYLIPKATTEWDNKIKVNEILTTNTKFTIIKSLNKVNLENFPWDFIKEKQIDLVNCIC